MAERYPKKYEKPADPTKRVVKSAQYGEDSSSGTAPLQPARSIALEQGFHRMDLHEMHKYSDPCPAIPVINLPAHTVELDNDHWEPIPVDYNIYDRHPKVHELLNVFPTVEEACKAKNWATCARFLGAGSFGQVYLGFRYSELAMPLAQRHLCAVKQCYIGKESKPKRDWKERQAQQEAKPTLAPIRSQVVANSVKFEVGILRMMKHHNIVRMLDCYAVEETRAAYFVLEYCDGGDLFREIMNTPNHRFSHPQARYYFVQAVAAVAYMHHLGIAHMDIKLENVLLKITPDGQGKVVKLADFGLSTVAFERKPNGKLYPLNFKSIKGTLPYCAPEMLAVRYAQHMEQVWKTYTPQPVSEVDARRYQLPELPADQRRKILILPGYREGYYRAPPCDVYALGVLLHCMITGAFPYDDSRWHEGIGLDHVFRVQPELYLSYMDTEAYELLCWLLEPAIKEAPELETEPRPKAREIATHRWMLGPQQGPGQGMKLNYLDEWQTMHVVRRDVPRVETEVPATEEVPVSTAPRASNEALLPGRGRRPPSDHGKQSPGRGARTRAASF